MSPWDKLLEKPGCEHFVQFYDRADETALTSNVGQYLADGVNRGDGVLIITTPEHRNLFFRKLESLGIDPSAALKDGQLLALDAQETLSRFFMSGWPDWNRFESVIGEAVRQLKRNSDAAAFRAYGEMVDLLWRNRQFTAALRLEHFWNKLLSRFSFSLYCAYATDLTHEKSRNATMKDILAAHTHTVPNVARQHTAALN
jgi:hypothetical protein